MILIDDYRRVGAPAYVYIFVTGIELQYLIAIFERKLNQARIDLTVCRVVRKIDFGASFQDSATVFSGYVAVAVYQWEVGLDSPIPPFQFATIFHII